MSRIEAIKQRLADATPGPWTRDEIDSLAGPCRDGDHYESDRLLIAHAPQDLRDLLELADAARVWKVANDKFMRPGVDEERRNAKERFWEILSAWDSPVEDEGGVT